MHVKYPNANPGKLLTTSKAYVTSVDDLYGHYLDSTTGFVQNNKMMEDAQTGMRAKSIVLPPNTNFDDLEFFYGRGSPNDPATCLQHRTTQGQFKRRNAKGGKNHVRAAQLLIVLLYSFWEHEYRPKLAEALGLANPNELRMPLFGEIRELRNDVLHHHGVVTRETVKKLLVFSNVQENKEIILTEITVGLLIGHIKEAIDNLVTDAGLEDPKYRTVWHFQ